MMRTILLILAFAPALILLVTAGVVAVTGGWQWWIFLILGLMLLPSEERTL